MTMHCHAENHPQAHTQIRSDRLALPQVTLCAVTSVNVAATVRALEASLEQVAFAACRLLTDVPVRPHHPEIEVVLIGRLASSAAYSDFLLTQLVDHVKTSHCLVTQWDGHLLDANRWQAQFLDCDYIGASWPQFGDGHDVGNGGFSLRSRRLLEACRAPQFLPLHPEDVAIGRTNRDWLEGQGMRFAPRDLADLFAAERTGDIETAFGYHGVFNMPRAIGVDAFWTIYQELDDLATIRPDFRRLLRAVSRGRNGAKRAVRMIADRVRWVR
ncbi:hypothetical protein SAMN05518801_11017 [Novosphingobium sp. CF614]|uniref:DUF5672 family protein n=1 Tax=Novosphingobium sp. CF614 TaxID=1884364 RepID=UPI0008E3BD2C|nr:DUF5672 family protein [Novosphingobium sp. CF614]SFG19796.1 hypothetical protein SAMN05518801_11017 [Novosphingobium sp. CF614]